MKIKSFLLICFFLSSIFIFGEETEEVNLLSYYNQNILSLNYSMWSGITVEKDNMNFGKIYFGLPKELTNTFLVYPEFEKTVKSINCKRRIGMGGFFLATGTYVGTMTYLNNIKKDQTPITTTQSGILITGFLGSLISLIISGILLEGSIEDLFDLVNSYNQIKIHEYEMYSN